MMEKIDPGRAFAEWLESKPGVTDVEAISIDTLFPFHFSVSVTFRVEGKVFSRSDHMSQEEVDNSLVNPMRFLWSRLADEIKKELLVHPLPGR